MSLLELRAEIDRRTEEEISRIVENAKNEAGKIVAEANVRAEALREERGRTLMRELGGEEMAQLAISRMKWKGEILRLKREWAGRVFDQASERIARIAERDGSEYRELLGRLILEGVANLKGNKFIVEANSRDQAAIKEGLAAILQEAARIKNDEVQLQTRLLKTALGGVVVSTEDGSQQYNNTLEARLSAATQNHAGEVRKILFRVVGQGE